MAALAVTLFLANILTNWVNDAFPALSFPLFAMAFLVGLAGVGVLHLIKAPHYLDTKLMGRSPVRRRTSWLQWVSRRLFRQWSPPTSSR